MSKKVFENPELQVIPFLEGDVITVFSWWKDNPSSYIADTSDTSEEYYAPDEPEF